MRKSGLPTGLQAGLDGGDAFAEFGLGLSKLLERAGEVLEFVVELLLDGREVVDRECRQVDCSGGRGRGGSVQRQRLRRRRRGQADRARTLL